MIVYWQTLSVLLLLASAAVLLVRGHASRRLAGIAIVLLLAFLPLGDTNAWLWLKGMVGSLSVVSAALLANYLITSLTGRVLVDKPSRKALYTVVLLAGLLLYPATLGLSLYDPYRLGYGLVVALAVLAVALAAWFCGRQAAAVVLAVVVLADQAGVSASVNTWDYLVDPLVWLVSPVMLVRLHLRA